MSGKGILYVSAFTKTNWPNHYLSQI